MSNFPTDQKEFTEAIIVQDAKKQYPRLMDALHRIHSFRHPFIMKLIECGVLPSGCGDFKFNCPLEGVMEITATYFIDKDAFERAIRETYTTGDYEKLAAENDAYAKKAEEYALLKKARRK